MGLEKQFVMQFEYPVEEWFTGQYADIPVDMQDSLKRYVIEKIKPGDFLSAVITNDLWRAVGHADAINLPLLKTYVQWFYNRSPSGCRGSVSAMEKWLASKPAEASVS